jgi:hypothetical protein
MTVHVHIERLVLDGVPVQPGGLGPLRDALQAELGRLLGTGPLPAALLAGGAVPALAARQVVAAPADGSPPSWGVHIARAVYSSLGR